MFAILPDEIICLNFCVFFLLPPLLLFEYTKPVFQWVWLGLGKARKSGIHSRVTTSCCVAIKFVPDHAVITVTVFNEDLSM